MYALSVKKQIGEQKFKICLKSLAQLGSAWLSSTQPGLTWLRIAIGSILVLKFKRSPFCSNTFEFYLIDFRKPDKMWNSHTL